MVQEGIALRHQVSARGIEVDKEKIEAIEKLPPPSSVKGIRSFLGHAGFDSFRLNGRENQFDYKRY